ncbi:alpha/beta hydrolase [Georgenia sp. EYE_87]|uniref:alpha/beta fold hydrolase n=1 Tax=Georgenia sp. EYE_87 TaxID=2853448 RepID=UPI00200664A3|nr:alpha/beta hydrolase [Georgenia sp. EYE_87]MCK6211594.1 alpha/beta hydrolase [Georgenia sp. EYE_87]
MARTQVERLFPPGRVVALVLVAVLVAALVQLRLSAQPDQLTVPPGAAAGDLSLAPCEYRGEGGVRAADCGTLVVAEHPADPASRMIALPLVRVRASSDDAAEPVLYLTGGPGQSNLALPFADRYAEHHDVVLVGYRGVDGSVRLECPEVDSAIRRTTDILGEAFFREAGRAYRDCADRLTEEGIDVAAYGLVQQVDDLETARVALGYDRVNLLSESAGTRTAMIYGLRRPGSIHRSVMIGANPPGAFLWDAGTTDAQIGRFATLCAEDEGCRARTDDLAATMRRTAAELPDRWLFLPVKESNVRTLSLFGLFETAPGGVASAPTMIDAWLSASEGDASGLWFASVLADVMLPELFVRGQYASAASLDDEAARRYFAGGVGDLTNLGRAATAFGWGGGLLADAWPAARETDQYRRLRTSQVETLVISGELDVSTPPQVAEADLLPYLPNGRHVVLPGFGHTGSVFGEQPEAGTWLINEYFDTGTVDDSRYQPQRLDLTPDRTHGAVARTIVGLMVGLGALTVVMLLLLARRARRTPAPAARLWVAALLRSVGAVILGAGGWCLGALVVLTFLPGARVDDQVVVALSVGTAVGLGTYLAWTRPGRSARQRRAGVAAAAVGAGVGAWLGYDAGTGLTVLAGAVLGAVAGANLALILLDVGLSRRLWSGGPARGTLTATGSVARHNHGSA